MLTRRCFFRPFILHKYLQSAIVQSLQVKNKGKAVLRPFVASDADYVERSVVIALIVGRRLSDRTLAQAPSSRFRHGLLFIGQVLVRLRRLRGCLGLLCGSLARLDAVRSKNDPTVFNFEVKALIFSGKSADDRDIQNVFMISFEPIGDTSAWYNFGHVSSSTYEQQAYAEGVSRGYWPVPE